jgi:serine/threonine protein kinase/transcriptional regulator with XRE-family HTH domain
MKSLLAPVRGIGGIDRVDLAVQLLEDEWRRHGQVDLNRLWEEQKRLLAVENDDSVALLAELIKADLRCRYERGQSPSITEYLESFSELRGTDDRVLSLIYEQFCLGEERGDVIDVEAFCARYPRWKDSLLSQLQYHRLFSQAAAVRPEPPTFPKPGDTFEEFQLLSLLGEGGTSRVFLARDLSLGGKQVVLKVSLDRGQEPKAQGALDHRHIIPVNSVVFDDRQLRGLSMPFRPGLPLDAVIKRVNPGSRPRGAMALWQTLVEGTEIPAGTPALERSEVDRQADGGRATGPQGDGWEGFPVRGTYPQGVAWIVMTLAEALDYAHRMRTFHRDVKPGNVLLTLHHGPQLLDFNLAESPHSASQAGATMQGGTLPYMAPEQIEAFLDPNLWGKVGAKADIYSLGLVLRELLTGQQPDLSAEIISPQRAMRLLLDRRMRLDVAVSRFNPAIPHGLEAILAKCLAFSSDARYPDARALAEDLHRFLTHRPLVHAVNPSCRERVSNWAMWQRKTLAFNVACLVAIDALMYRPVTEWFKSTPPPIAISPGLAARVESHLPDTSTATFVDGRSVNEMVLDLRRLRAEAGLRQRDLAEIAGTDEWTIRRLEEGHFEECSLATLQRLAAAMGYRVAIAFPPAEIKGDTPSSSARATTVGEATPERADANSLEMTLARAAATEVPAYTGQDPPPERSETIAGVALRGLYNALGLNVMIILIYNIYLIIKLVSQSVILSRRSANR